MNVPLKTSICLKAYTGNNLQNEFVWRTARCVNQNTDAWEQMVLIQTEDKKFLIQSRWDGRNLQVQDSGLCVFANHNQGLSEKFDLECNTDGKVFFVSCLTGNVMQCDERGHARCVNKNRLEWEAWTIIFPQTTKMMTSQQLRFIALSATGAILAPLIGLAAGAMVPLAMSTFGTVVAGVGTIHAPLAAGGCAAILQASSTALVSVNASAIGGLVGAAISTLFGPFNATNDSKEAVNVQSVEQKDVKEEEGNEEVERENEEKVEVEKADGEEKKEKEVDETKEDENEKEEKIQAVIEGEKVEIK